MMCLLLFFQYIFLFPESQEYSKQNKGRKSVCLHLFYFTLLAQKMETFGINPFTSFASVSLVASRTDFVVLYKIMLRSFLNLIIFQIKKYLLNISYENSCRILWIFVLFET
jgi:hypothetical protein